MRVPKIVGEWKPLFTPSKFGDYVNDHCIVPFGEGYRLLGITSFSGRPVDEKYFVNAKATIFGENAFEEECVAINNGTPAWSPCVVLKDGFSYCFYGPSPTKLAVSYDFVEWMGQEIYFKGNPPASMHRDHFVYRCGDKWYMYAVGIKDGRGCVSCMTSDNLIDWEWVGYALTLGEKAKLTPGWGALESPFVVDIDGKFYLFVTYTDSGDDTYNDTLVFTSDDLLNFGSYECDGGVEPVARLSCHAPEVLKVNGEYYITTCGWKRKPVPNAGSVSFAKLDWVEE